MSVIVHQQNTNLFVPGTNYTTINVTGNIACEPIAINGYSLYAIQHFWTGASGSIQIIVEGSVIEGTKTDDDYTVINTTLVTGAKGNALFNFEKAGFSYVRVRIAYSSGSMTFKSVLNGKIL